MATKKLLTLDQLVDFCKSNKFYSFNSNESGYTLSVQVPGKLSYSNNDNEDLMYTNVKVCHTELNRNGSFISEDNMKKAMKTLAYKPLLASIIETEDGLDFNGHDMEFTEDENGNTVINYIEKQVGTFTTTAPYLEYDKDMDKTYVIAEAVIPREYTKAAEIIERKNGTKVSCELCINAMSYNAKEKYLELEDFYFSGVCCLGESVGEGMIGSRLDIKDFSTENNSVKFEQDDKLIEVLEKLEMTLSNFNINSERKEDTEVDQKEKIFEEVAETEEVEVTEEPTEEEAAAEEETSEDATEVTPESEVTEEFTEEETETVEETDEEETVDGDTVEFSVTHNGEVKIFSVSLNDKLNAIYTLVNETYGEVDNDYYDVVCYEDNNIVEMHGYFTGKSYRQSYKKKKQCSYQLVGDRVEIYSVWMTEDEMQAFESMKANYSVISDKLDKFECEPQKMEILESADYGYVAETEEFIALKDQANHFDLSVDEVKANADEILLNYAKASSFNFNATQVEKKVESKKLPTGSHKTSRYGNLFKK